MFKLKWAKGVGVSADVFSQRPLFTFLRSPNFPLAQLSPLPPPVTYANINMVIFPPVPALLESQLFTCVI